MATGQEVIQMLVQRGYDPLHAAVIAGHMQQESGFNPEAYNPKENAYGGVQWRLDRLDNLRKFAADRGLPASDMGVQLDFIKHEMQGPESKSGAAFMAAKDLPSAHAALKSYIRYGDNSDSTRIANARALLGGSNAAASAASSPAPFSMAAPAATSPAPTPTSAPASAPDIGSLLKILQQNAQDDPQDEGATLQPIAAMQLTMAKPLGLAAARRLISRMKDQEA